MKRLEIALNILSIAHNELLLFSFSGKLTYEEKVEIDPLKIVTFIEATIYILETVEANGINEIIMNLRKSLETVFSDPIRSYRYVDKAYKELWNIVYK